MDSVMDSIYTLASTVAWTAFALLVSIGISVAAVTLVAWMGCRLIRRKS